ncbi:MAG: PEP-CTERM sorting domain-containing protein [Chitinispirillaceae bacterium]|nr:PEP-CTERM sorting domain-containing protein [Chitinispirillaceae bacterium]
MQAFFYARRSIAKQQGCKFFRQILFFLTIHKTPFNVRINCQSKLINNYASFCGNHFIALNVGWAEDSGLSLAQSYKDIFPDSWESFAGSLLGHSSLSVSYENVSHITFAAKMDNHSEFTLKGIEVSSAEQVPEPGMISLLGFGVLAFSGVSFFRRKK